MDQQVKRVKRELIKHGAILDMYEDTMELDRKSTRLNSSHANESRMPSSA